MNLILQMKIKKVSQIEMKIMKIEISKNEEKENKQCQGRQDPREFKQMK